MKWKEQFFGDWEYSRKDTIKFIETVPEDKLGFSPHKDWGSIGRQLRHMADVQECYIKAIDTKKVTFQNKRKDFSMETDKQKLIDYMKKLDKQLKEKIKKLSENDLLTKVDWEEVGNPSIAVMLNYMKDHEIYHQGILQVYASLAGFPTPRFF